LLFPDLKDPFQHITSSIIFLFLAEVDSNPLDDRGIIILDAHVDPAKQLLVLHLELVRNVFSGVERAIEFLLMVELTHFGILFIEIYQTFVVENLGFLFLTLFFKISGQVQVALHGGEVFIAVDRF
jgi:hypothetical protein